MTRKWVAKELPEPGIPKYNVPVHIARVDDCDKVYCGKKDWMLRVANRSRWGEASCEECVRAAGEDMPGVFKD